jgi:hypothetical protein
MTEHPEKSAVESDVPRNVVERACDAALRAAELSLENAGAEAVQIFVTLHAKDVPAGELDAASAGHGYEAAGELLAELLGAASALGKALGLRIDVIPNFAGKGGQG